MVQSKKMYSREEFFKKIVEPRIESIRSTLQTKGTEYGADKSAFHNFTEAAGNISFHSSREKVAWEYMTKHLQSIKDIISNNGFNGIDNQGFPSRTSKETIREKIGDAINYLILIEGMLLEDLEDPFDSVKFNSPTVSYGEHSSIYDREFGQIGFMNPTSHSTDPGR